MLATLFATLLLPLALAGDLDLTPRGMDAVRLGRVHARVEQYRRGELALPVPDALAPTVQLASGLGGQVYRLDSAALKASAALARTGALEDPRLAGWLCIDAGEDVHVIFVGLDPADEDVPGGLYHAVVSLKAGTVQWGDFVAPTEQRPLRGEPGPHPQALFPFDDALKREWTAHQLVLRAHPGVAGAPVDPVVVQVDPTPGAETYLVFLLARSPDPGRVQFGGHQAYKVRFAGDKVGLEPFAVASDTISWDRAELEASSGDEQILHGFFRSTAEVPVPRELHVYESLVYELPFFLLAQENLWHIHGVDIRYLGRVE
jgi:hypothetical protein